MIWSTVREAYPDQWLIIEALAAHSEGNQRLLDRIAVIETCADRATAKQSVRRLHREYPARELYFAHTGRETLDIRQRRGVGKPDAISWWELLLILLLVVGGMAIWAFAEQQVDAARRKDEPQEESFQIKAQVPLRQAELSQAQGELLALQQRLVQERLALAAKRHLLERMASRYPALQDPAIASAELLSTPPEVVQSYIDSTVDQTAAHDLMDSLDAQMAGLVSETTALSATLKSQQTGSQKAVTQAKLSLANKALEAIQDELVSQRIELAQQTASRDALTAAYPQLLSLAGSTTPLDRAALIPSQVLESYDSARFESEVSAHLVDTLAVSVTELISITSQRTEALANAQQEAKQDLVKGQNSFTWSKRGWTLLWALIGIGSFGLVAWFVASWLTARTSFALHKGLVFGGAALILLVLLGYELFELFGAIVGGTLALPVALALLTAPDHPAEATPVPESTTDPNPAEGQE